MIKSKQLELITNTIKAAIDTYGIGIFSKDNQSLFLNFVEETIKRDSESKEILKALQDICYFDFLYDQKEEIANELAKRVLIAYGATKEQIDKFLENIFDFFNNINNNKEAIREEKMLDEKTDYSEEIEDSIEEQEEEIVEEEEEEIEEQTITSSSQRKNTSEDSEKENTFFDGKISFCIRLIIAIVLFIGATIAIEPKDTAVFYKWYFVLFIIFSVIVLACCCIAQIDISLLWNFYIKFKQSRGRKEDLISKNKNINSICHAYTESFLLNETYNKTRSNSDLYFGGETYFNDMNKLPIQAFLKIIPGTFIGFGILGTFIGFADGLKGLTGALANQDTAELLKGIGVLIDGLSGAFNTSIVGILASMFLNYVIIHPLLNRLDRCSKILCDYLDTKFFVSEVDAMSVTDKNNKQIPFPETMGIVLTKLEQVASNINQMGATVGDQVTQSVKATLDKTIEKIIKAEIKQLKEEMNSSIALLQECQKHLQNAPTHLKEAAEKMQAAAINNDEIFRRQSQESVEVFSNVVEVSFKELNEKFGAYSKIIEEASEEMLNIKNTLALMPEDFGNVDKSIKATTERLSANQATLENALSESTTAFDKTTEISEALTEAYESQSKKIEDMIAKFTDILKEYKETSKESKELLSGFKGLDEQIAQIFEHINENTKNYSEVIGNSLATYLNGFSEATKDISAKFADATDALREEIEKLNKSLKPKEEK